MTPEGKELTPLVCNVPAMAMHVISTFYSFHGISDSLLARDSLFNAL